MENPDRPMGVPRQPAVGPGASREATGVALPPRSEAVARRSAPLVPSADILVLGAGVMGLWAARHARAAGLTVLVVDPHGPGHGASGGLLGALMPHGPDQWSDKKQFQFEALVSLEAEIAALEAETGLSTGYRRSGRLILLPKPHLRPLAEARAVEAARLWQSPGRDFAWRVVDRSPVDPSWPAESAACAGLVEESLSARVSPRALLAALAAAVEHPSGRGPAGAIRLAVPHRIDARRRRVMLADGSVLAYGHLVIAAGVDSFSLLERLDDGAGGADGLDRAGAGDRTDPCHASERPPLGMGVKGQAVLLDARIDPDRPLLYLDGLYIVPHETGQVAIGSTSENRFAAPRTTDGLLDGLLERAFALVPALRQAPVLERWAGLRPKAIGRDPMVGPHPDHPTILALTGGFKVSFGLAHALARAALGPIVGGELGPILPPAFSVARHLAEVRSKAQPTVAAGDQSLGIGLRANGDT